jgi:hypothetical protein
VYQFRLSTLLLAFVVVWSALAVFGGAGGIAMAAVLLAGAAYVRSPRARKPVSRAVAVLLCSSLGGFLLVAASVARESAHHQTCQCLLRYLGLALYSYEGSAGSFPPAAVANSQGNATQSWRVLILPFMTQDVKYQEYDTKEPWNSPKNSSLLGTLQNLFCCPSQGSTSGRPVANYLAVTGPGAIWGRPQSAARPLRPIVVEVADSKTAWTEPHDLTLDEACRSVAGGAGCHVIPGGFFFQDEPVVNVLFSDATVRSIPAGLPLKTVRGIFTGDASEAGIRLLPDWPTAEMLHRWGTLEGGGEEFRRGCQELPMIRHRKIHWVNCAALAVLVMSYAVLLFRPRDKLPPEVEPAAPGPAAVAGGNEAGDHPSPSS